MIAHIPPNSTGKKPTRKSSPLSDIDNTRRAIDDLKLDVKKWERIYKQILKIEGEEAKAYTIKDKITISQNLIDTLTKHLIELNK